MGRGIVTNHFLVNLGDVDHQNLWPLFLGVWFTKVLFCIGSDILILILIFILILIIIIIIII